MPLVFVVLLWRQALQRDERLQRYFGAKICVSKQKQTADFQASRAADGRAVGGSLGFGVSKPYPAADGQANRQFHHAAKIVKSAPVPQFLDAIIEVMKVCPKGMNQRTYG